MSSSVSNALSDLTGGPSIDPFGNSRISVGIGNTIVSFAFFGVGPSVVAYAILKVLEEKEESKKIIPYSNPLTLPITAFILNRVFNMNALGLLAAGGLYACFEFLRGTSSPARASTTFRNLMFNISLFFDRFIQKTRYTIQDLDAMTIYTIYLPQNIEKSDVTVCWTSATQSNSLHSFCVYLPGTQNALSKYVECSIKYAVDPRTVIVSFSKEDDGNVLTVRIPKYSTTSVLLTIH